MAEKKQSYILPSQVRTFASTLSGDTSPITEENFSASEIKQMRDAVMRSKARQPSTKKVFKDGKVKEAPRTLDPTVDYEDYGDNAKRAILDYSPLPSDAARNTLGRFRYEKTPNGRLVAHDSYDFKDEYINVYHFETTRDPRSLRFEEQNIAVETKIRLEKEDVKNI